MFNSQSLNNQIFGGGPAPLSLSQDNFIFDGYSLNNASLGIRVMNIDYDDLGTIDIETYNNPQIDGGGVLSHLYHKKTITFTLSLSAISKADLDILVDNVKLWTKKIEGVLEVDVDGNIRTCLASRSSINFGRKYYNINFIAGVKITFVTMSPHWTAKVGDYERYSITGNHYEDLNYLGTAPTYPKYYFVFNGSGNAGITSLTITVGGTSMVVTQAITNSDVLIIDGETKTVNLNGTNIDYTGIFEKINNGSNIITLAFNGGATINATLNIIYNKKFY